MERNKYDGSMASTPGARRRARGEIEKLPSGSLRVRVSDGTDPVTGKRRYLVETVPAGPRATREAERVRRRLCEEAEKRRGSRADGERRRNGSPTPDEPIAEDAPTWHSRPGDGATTSEPITPDIAAWHTGPGVPPGEDDRPQPPARRRRDGVTVAAIARFAGVSVPTVSKVLNGRPGVAAQTRLRVETLLREHGYRRPPMVAPAPTVEVVFYGMHSFLGVAILHGVEQVAGEHKLAVGFTDVARQVAMGRSWADDLLARRPTGVVTVFLGVSPEQHALLNAGAIPVVAVDPAGDTRHGVPSVRATNWSGGVDAARHLLDLGHRRIAVITGPVGNLGATARLEGARAAMKAAGTPLDDRLVRRGRSFSVNEGTRNGRDLLRLPEPPTAVLCGNDLQALGVYTAAAQAGVRIPDELSVIGFDDIPYTGWCIPPMTTVRQPFREMGAAAARLVLSLAWGKAVAGTRLELATTLVPRASTAPPGR